MTKRIKYTYGTILSLAIIALVIRAIAYPELSAEVQWGSFLISIIVLTIYWEGTRLINNFLNNKMSFEEGLVKRIILQLVMVWVLIFSIRWTLILLFEDIVPFEISNPFRAAIVAIDFFFSLALNLYYFGIYFFTQWKKSLLKVERLQKEKSLVQFDNLRNQLNPHFLFNAFTSLNSLIHENQELASQYLQHLSKVYRYMLKNKEKELVSLRTELHFLQNYLFLLEARFDGAFRVEIKLDEQDMEKLIVPVTLQNLTENAIKHNIINKQKPLLLQIFTEAGYLVMQNNLQKKSTVETSNEQGLENLRSLYKYLSHKEVLVEEGQETFAVKVPLV